MSINKRIENTPTFKNLDPIHRDIYQRSSARKQVENNYMMAKQIGVERWLEIEKPNTFYKNTVLDLLKQDEDDTKENT